MVSPLIQGESKFEVNFDYKLSGYVEEDFMVKPVVSRGDTLSNSFTLSTSHTLLIQGLNFGESDLFFEIRDLKTGGVYRTPTKRVWVDPVYSKYIEKINSNVRAFVNAKMVK